MINTQEKHFEKKIKSAQIKKRDQAFKISNILIKSSKLLLKIQGYPQSMRLQRRPETIKI